VFSVNQQHTHALASFPASTELFAQNLLRSGAGKLEVNPSSSLTVFQNTMFCFTAKQNRGTGRVVSTFCGEQLAE